jgi:hypothetical protein
MALDYRQCHINAGWAMGNIPLYLFLQSIWAFASVLFISPLVMGSNWIIQAQTKCYRQNCRQTPQYGGTYTHRRHSSIVLRVPVYHHWVLYHQ